MIKDIRSYVKDRVEEINYDMTMLDDMNGEGDIAENELNNGYKVYFGNSTIENVGNHYVDSVVFTVEHYAQLESDKKLIDIYDDLYDLAYEIKDNILDPIKVKNQSSFTDIFGTSILLESLATNEGALKSKIEFRVQTLKQY